MLENKKFRIRPKAEKDLENIYEYSYQEFGSARADQYIRDLDATFHMLADDPSLGSDYSHVRPDLMAYRVVSHVVFFKPSV
ncbi:MAG: type II toxin-antitoxin system RelE/ParE family toxin [Candidatus Thiodiazotropha sp. (ex Lucinoma kastoroae)]|nr:type II toxin-antitoxin system RelE/ParE family toxin [Candidatus Thiodiazotropha sp. (ex Lucinoma kastoroae)]